MFPCFSCNYFRIISHVRVIINNIIFRYRSRQLENSEDNHSSRQGTFFNQKLLISFLFLHENICCGYLSEASHQGASNEYPQHMFSWRNKKNIYLDIPHSVVLIFFVLFGPKNLPCRYWLELTFRDFNVLEKSLEIITSTIIISGATIFITWKKRGKDMDLRNQKNNNNCYIN